VEEDNVATTERRGLAAKNGSDDLTVAQFDAKVFSLVRHARDRRGRMVPQLAEQVVHGPVLSIVLNLVCPQLGRTP